MSGAQYEVTRLSRRLERKEEVFLRRYLLDRLVWDHGDTEFRDEYVRRFGKLDRDFEGTIRYTVDMFYGMEEVPYLDREWLDRCWLKCGDTERLIDLDELWALYEEQLDEMVREKKDGTYIPYNFKRATPKEKGFAKRKKGKKWVR